MNKLREVRFLRGLRQFDLAKRSGVHPTRISPIEKGYIDPSLDQKTRLAQALGVSVFDIWPDPTRGKTLITEN